MNYASWPRPTASASSGSPSPIRVVGSAVASAASSSCGPRLAEPGVAAGPGASRRGVRTPVPSPPTWWSRRVGQGAPVRRCLGALPELKHDQGRIHVAHRQTGATSIPRLFAGRRLRRRPGEVVDAVDGHGQGAAAGLVPGQSTTRRCRPRLIPPQDGHPPEVARWSDRRSRGRPELLRPASSAEPFLAGVRARRPTPSTRSRRAFDAGWGGAVWKTLGRADRQRLVALRRHRLRRPKGDGAQ